VYKNWLRCLLLFTRTFMIHVTHLSETQSFGWI